MVKKGALWDDIDDDVESGGDEQGEDWAKVRLVFARDPWM